MSSPSDQSLSALGMLCYRVLTLAKVLGWGDVLHSSHNTDKSTVQLKESKDEDIYFSWCLGIELRQHATSR